MYIKPSLFPSCFANDLKADKAAVLASEQRPVALGVLEEKSRVPAWKTIPSWYLIGTLDLVIPPFAQFFMAQRAHATITYANAAHPSMISHPRAVADLIIQAAQSQGKSNKLGTRHSHQIVSRNQRFHNRSCVARCSVQYLPSLFLDEISCEAGFLVETG